MPLASVIIPTYNRSDLIMRTLNSVLAQSLDDIEVIVVDDGSSDNTHEIISRYTDSRLHYIHKENGGVSSARNTGIDSAQGEYVFFLDDDDEWYDNHLEVMVNTLRASEEYGAVYCPWGERDCPLGSLDTDKPSGQITTELFKKGIVHIIACGIKRDVLDGVRFDTSLKIAEDSDFLLQVSLKTPFLFTTNTCAIHNTTEVSLTSRFDESRVLSLERFYFRLGGDGVIPRKTALTKLSKACRSVAKHYARQDNQRAARWYYGKAIGYRPTDLRNYVPFASAVTRSLTSKTWKPPETLRNRS